MVSLLRLIQPCLCVNVFIQSFRRCTPGHLNQNLLYAGAVHEQANPPAEPIVTSTGVKKAGSHRMMSAANLHGAERTAAEPILPCLRWHGDPTDPPAGLDLPTVSNRKYYNGFTLVRCFCMAQRCIIGLGIVIPIGNGQAPACLLHTAGQCIWGVWHANASPHSHCMSCTIIADAIGHGYDMRVSKAACGRRGAGQ